MCQNYENQQQEQVGGPTFRMGSEAVIAHLSAL